jgi:hypothetical protein
MPANAEFEFKGGPGNGGASADTFGFADTLADPGVAQADLADSEPVVIEGVGADTCPACSASLAAGATRCWSCTWAKGDDDVADYL